MPPVIPPACIPACGTNAHCEYGAVNQCVCNTGTVGNPYEGCGPQEKKSCSTTACGIGAECREGINNVECVCPPGFGGNPYVQCNDVDECSGSACGNNAVCINTPGSYDCRCKKGYTGNPFIVCLLPEPETCENPATCTCSKDVPCPTGYSCDGGHCKDLCDSVKCGPRAVCDAGKCICPPGFTGNPSDQKSGCKPRGQCQNDLDCNTAQICFQLGKGVRKCLDACSKIQCGPNALCVAENHRSSCICADGYVGNPGDLFVGCQPDRGVPKGECETDHDCASGLVCALTPDGFRACLNPCANVACAQNEVCHLDHTGHPVCSCLDSFVWNPVSSACEKPSLPDCTADTDCPQTSACRPDALGVLKCVSVCSEFTCPANAVCVAIGHQGQCQCLPSYTGNPNDRNGCKPALKNQCSTDAQCPESDTCRADGQTGVLVCKSACDFLKCGPHAVCIANNHVAQCQCPPGPYAGDPNDPTSGCKTVPCVYNIDCPPTQLCNRLTHTCYDVCEEESCGENAVCIAEDHRAVCQCPPGFRANPLPEVECVPTEVCSPNPCHPSAVCEGTPSGHTCRCPPGHVGDPFTAGCRPEGNCPKGDSDCPPQSTCVAGRCVNPCDGACGPNAICNVVNRRPVCTCPLKFEAGPSGPVTGCLRTAVVCVSDADCHGTICHNGQCKVACRNAEDCTYGERCVQNMCTLPCGSHSQCPAVQACVSGICLIGCRSSKDCPSEQACVNNKCQDPCKKEGVCGPNAVCRCVNHVTECECPPGFVGNPVPQQGCVRIPTNCGSNAECPSGHSCLNNLCTVPCVDNSHCAVGERCTNSVCVKVCYGDSNCVPGEVCIEGTCQAGCGTDSDCKTSEICLHNKCRCGPGFTSSPAGCLDINECNDAPCHSSAHCINDLGSYRCVCPAGTVGDPFLDPGCVTPNECSHDAECSDSLACEHGKCTDPCVSGSGVKCGPNAICNVFDHLAVCSCPAGYLGDPNNIAVGCFKVECLSSDDCSLDKFCDGQSNKCMNPCDQVNCGRGTCKAQNHEGLCSCFQGYTIVNGKCVDIDECIENPCHNTAICKNSPGSFTCQCPDGLVGDPVKSGCRKPGDCFTDSDCPSTAECVDNRCRNPCENPIACGRNAECLPTAHQAVCRCPAQTRGDAKVECVQLECADSNDCDQNKACIDSHCVDPCSLPNVCGQWADCLPVNHVGVCSCQSGHTGNPHLGCVPVQYCSSNLQCPAGTKCNNGICTSECTSARECISDQLCIQGVCQPTCKSNDSCPAFQFCQNSICVQEIRCRSDYDCDDTEKCRENGVGQAECMNACEGPFLCGRNAECTAQHHEAICTCKTGYHGNPRDDKIGCQPIECNSNEDCSNDKLCEDYMCKIACLVKNPCGINALCSAQDHNQVCFCQPGYTGDPQIGCQLIDFCADSPCGPEARCDNSRGSYKCLCPIGTVGDPYHDGCHAPVECTHDEDCPSAAECTHSNGVPKCKDVCENSVCGPNAECVASDHVGACVCRSGYEGNPNDLHVGCRPKPVPCRANSDCPSNTYCYGDICRPSCQSDEECSLTEKCLQGQCNNPCDQRSACGMNAECRIFNHNKQCTCPPGFTGNQDVECVRIPVSCESNVDCIEGNTCRDNMCLPVCQGDQECAFNEKCLKGNCILTCRVDNDCFLGHICLHNMCIYGCHSDEDCSASESCRDNRCVNPCSDSPCGPNAVCTVSNQRASCSCRSGFVPNPSAKVACVRAPAQPCTENRACPAGSTCMDDACRPVCSSDIGCLGNERCDLTSGVCKPLCRRDDDCRSGEVCEGLVCVTGCRSDSGCPADRACINSKCIDLCASPTACGTNAQCIMSNHQKLCSCPVPLIGDPETGCRQPTSLCQSEDDCPHGQTCYVGMCQTTCRSDQNCLADERCLGGLCRTVCNSDAKCGPKQICEDRLCDVGCRSDTVCSDNEACINKQCRNPCEDGSVCGSCASCRVVNHGVQCSCPANFLGNPLVSCYKPSMRCGTGIPDCECDEVGYCTKSCASDHDCSCGETCAKGKCRTKCYGPNSCAQGQLCQRGLCVAGCRSHNDCPNDQACISGQCHNPCTTPEFPCGTNAQCRVSEHRAICLCPDGYQGEPSQLCKQYECLQDDDCEADKYCGEDKACRYPCLKPGACGTNAQCRAVNRHAQCSCPPGYFGNPQIECKQGGDQCLRNPCGDNAKCRDIPGGFECTCVPGCIGDPYRGCLCEGPQKDQCRDKQCGVNAACRVVNNREPECYCPKNYPAGNPYIECTIDRTPTDCRTEECGKNAECIREGAVFVCRCPPGTTGRPEVECRAVISCWDHSECPAQQACIGEKCLNPCSIANPCNAQQECQVHEHQPVCVKVCQCQKHGDCRPGHICDGCHCGPIGNVPKTGCEHCPPGYQCNPLTGACIKETPGTTKAPSPCETDSDCVDTEACYKSFCLDPCEFTNACAATAKCNAKAHRPICTCPTGYEGDPAVNCTPSKPLSCSSNDDCPLTEACIGGACQHPCDTHNPCAFNAVCINTNHGTDCSCAEGFHGNGFVGCAPVTSPSPVCHYNEDCPPHKLCDRLNRVCINPCMEDSCGENAKCLAVNHGIDCKCLDGYSGNPYVECLRVTGCRSDDDCHTNEACINNQCQSPCKCGLNAICEVLYHKATCKCLPGYTGNPAVGCQGPSNPCDPNPCGTNAMCEIDNGNPICFCPKGLTGNPFRNCIPEGDSCAPNPCGPNSGCRVVNGSPLCFCLPEYEGNPPSKPCSLPSNPCDPSPCGPNTQCAILSNGFAKCTCLPGFLESPNTIRGCVEKRNPCDPNPCGHGALCDPNREPACFCPEPFIGNPYRSCGEPEKHLCQPGPCGNNADCYITENQETCYCKAGYIGDPYSGCFLEPANPCLPNPCGPNALCTVSPQGHPMCLCPEGMSGDPTGPSGCGGPECRTDDDCSNKLACIAYKCRDPCPGSCGIGASCRVEKHHPVCTCNHGLTGNPLIRCSPLPVPPPSDPCHPSPCAVNAFCQVLGGRAVCSCMEGFEGDPSVNCHPECVLNTDCPLDKACLDRRCIDPCASGAVCGLRAICLVRDHTATCACPEGHTGDAFTQCIPRPPVSADMNLTRPCAPSPCDPGIHCNVYGGQVAMCDPCSGPGSINNLQCRPECLAHSDCPFNLACLGRKCRDPCPGSCGVNANCMVINHNPVCSCPSGLVGNPFEHCSTPPPNIPPEKTCDTVQCGANAVCQDKNGVLSCVCKPEYFGNPYLSCRPECVLNTDCANNLACINNKCQDPCAGACGVGAQCNCVNHVPVCFCPPQTTGDPFVSCYPFRPEPPTPLRPCDPSPCGPYSRCLVSPQGFATCSCLPGYRGSPPVCTPECVVSSDCLQTQACVSQHCVDPCPGTCGIGARCAVINHNPICSCPPGDLGDPFVSCHKPTVEEQPKDRENPCNPSPCGPNSICQVKQGRPVCSCVPNYIGSPPFCRPECVLSQECPWDKACIQEKCQNPCTNSCGSNAKCDVVNHTPFCSCLPNYEGDAFVGCSKIEKPKPMPAQPVDPCNPSPCGENAQCSPRDGVARCTCIPPYKGNPYVSCRPECVINSDCPSHLACVAQNCRDPCQGVCGVNAECNVVNHIPVCSCIRGFMGDPFKSCRQEPPKPIPPQNPCEPSPCGPNSVCRIANGHAVCSCQPNFLGSPPSCRPECVVSSECPQNQACISQKCQDPCPGTCGVEAQCQVVNHNPICSCPPRFTGDPFVQCIKEVPTLAPPTTNPCVPSPCGANSDCRVVDGRPVCSCLPGMLGAPPNCRPECLIHQDCPTHLACVRNKCRDPCTGSCGFNAKCTVHNHQPVCTCNPGFEGDPFSGCNPATERTPATPCFPSPCGPNAECRERNGAGSCSCLPGYEGDPYDLTRGCRRECEVNTDCPQTLACITFKCVDPCPGTCGTGAQCNVLNHIPTCTCPPDFTGDPFFQCRLIPPTSPTPPRDPCSPSPCGPNSQCRVVNQQAVCSCLQNYVGSPPQCRPECVVSSECPLDRACVNMKCADPCPNTCGIGAQCTTKNHNPICACPPGFTGDPFSQCTPQPMPPVVVPTPSPPSCIPSPCGPNSQCQIVAGNPACSCLPDHIGAPPNCRPECVLSAECPSQLACINQKCRDPCPGSCGYNANCHVLNHIPVCLCNDGHTGDPFTQCSPIPPSTPPPRSDPCNPSPCGANAVCRPGGVCECSPEYVGNPYEACRPECVLNTECKRNQACIRNKCRDPCPGTCGQNARCDVVNHIPTCSCPQGFTGDPFSNCRQVVQDVQPPTDPCRPSPCGPNSQCRTSDNHAVCSCLQGYMGSPPSCRPECVVSAECPQTRACVNQKCTDPCLGSCGLGARCEVINHSPICSCREGQTGDPFRSCFDIPPPPPVPPVPRNPCAPNPCGPNSQCQVSGDSPGCSCLDGYVGSPPNCRPECVINPDCPSQQACVNNKCRDPCPGSCGTNAQCQVVSHAVTCICSPGFTGNPFVQCVIQQNEVNPCEPSPCGANAVCTQRNGAGACSCIPDYQGNPYEGCRPECVLSSDCPTDRACVRNKCEDPCPGVCGQFAQCTVVNHIPTCTCIQGYMGNPFSSCTPQPAPPATPPPVANPCQPSPCGPNSRCRVVNGQAVCSCEDQYIGSPPNCRPECVINNNCPQNRACNRFKCADPCPGTCGIGARCEVINHNPICSCPSGFTGDPFVRCTQIPPTPPPPPAPKPANPCVPSPCGPNSDCRPVGDQPACSCLQSFIGSPPNCRPECIVNTDCDPTKACITSKCRDPCPGSCGVNAECRVQNHIPICTCVTGFTGDPFTQCSPVVVQEPTVADPCNPSPCGSNAQCNNGQCTCLPNYFGDPYTNCRPECTMNAECPRNRACNNQRCIDPCPGTCGQGARCDVVNHIPTCSCPEGTSGDPFVACRPIPPQPAPSRPCEPSPCGPNSICRVVNDHAVCSCQPGLVGNPPTCRPECVVSAECPLTQACLSNKCRDPCPGTCGLNARCQVVNHNPICSCSAGNTGDPFTRCFPVPVVPTPAVPVNPCQPSPCGPNSECQVRGESPACSCQQNYIGSPPNCRPECTINPECSSNVACINQKCRDPCPGSCGANARCNVVNHTPVCTCNPGFTGDPFSGCVMVQATPTPPTPAADPCNPSPCGSNARCRVENSFAICECLPEYHGNPYEGCRPECLVSSDCPMNRACIRNKCQDPCPGTCGVSAICTVSNHIPICSCPDGTTGDAFRICTPIREQPQVNPCNPSPCGANTQCRASDGTALCECLPGFHGNPSGSGCRPECVISSDCPRDKACVNTKCVDPCPGVCGYGARCQVINHSPICSCPPPTIGDPFVECKEQPPPPVDPCNPSPCNVNGQCRVVNGAAACQYPECIINQDCPRDKACFAQKCQDPCVDACGVNALCQVVNHNPICSCPEGYVGSPRVSCQLKPVELPPKPECTDNSECTNDKACINQACRNPCVEFPNTCGVNSLCHVQLHRPLCVCKDGFTGSAQGQCYEIGCRSDSECPPTQACVNRQCEDPCSYTQCGVNAVCRADGNHRARCYCPDNYRGDPFVQCTKPECTSDDECPYNLACRNERCENPCNCAPGALCTVTNHRPACQCPPGYIGNPHVGCTIAPIIERPQCTVDADCASKLACFSGTCRNPCVETKPCAANAACTVVDTLPLRTMSCSCLPGFVGDADVECKPAEEPGCKSNDDCPQSDTCLNRQCVNPCTVSNPCASNAECHATNHRAVCQCPNGLTGNPLVNCYQVLQKPECTSDSECPGDKSCISEHCQDPCTVANPCGSGAECHTVQHRPVCNCPDGWGGNPQVQCYRPECKADSDCVYDKACINGNCLNPCKFGTGSQCGKGAECHVQSHRAQCVCPAGTQGNPLLSCISVVCQYNEDCADDEACDRLNRVCRPVCESDTCAETAVCIGRDHQPKCICPPGTTGNAYIECTGPRIPPQPECKVDADCSSQLACINTHCQNPCAVANVCSLDQECRVLDTLPLRTVMCLCPPDTIADSNGRCVPILPVKPQCTMDGDCSDSDKCVRSRCAEACHVDLCGVNALCNSQGHRAICSCPPGYEGNPHVECSRIRPPITPPECYIDTDCAKDRSCINLICVNPCLDNPCASGAFCHVQDHQPICRCPAGYEGNPRIECRPSLPLVGCTSNSECTLQESCVNGLCVNPCNCGPNAECRVSNHYPVCYCQQGYSGNPQAGCFKVGCQSDNECSNDKMCYNGECLNPCILGVPCAANAECYGDAHRAACRCPSGYAGNPFDRCERVECRVNSDCPADKACLEHRCINPCASIANPPCASNAICYAQNHAAGCRCPEHLPIGNPLAYCERAPVPPQEPECRIDVDCPSRLACIRNECVNPCIKLSPCSPTAHCMVLDTVPVRTMTCTCPEGWVPNVDGECRPVVVPMPPGCTSDNDCPTTEACINRVCRNPCDCGTNANCLVQNHRPICSCEAGFEGNPNIACHAVGCRSDSECDSGKACVNANCVNPCLVHNPCGSNAECYPYGNRAECRCLSGYRGNPYIRCYVVGCRSNNDCPNDRACINAQCINPCIYDNVCAPRAECHVQNHFAVCRCPPGYIGNPYVGCRPEPRPECKEDPECPTRLACLNEKCQDPCRVLEPCQRPSECLVVGSVPVRTMICVCPSGYVSSGSGTCKPTPPVTTIGGCVSDADCPEDKACVRGVCRDLCNCGPNADCRIKDHKPICACKEGYDGNPEIECVRVGCRSDSDCSGQHTCVNRNCVPVCALDGSSCGNAATCYGANHRAVCECPPGLSGNPKVACVFLGCRSDSECPPRKACINNQCMNPCDEKNPCKAPAECRVYNHRPNCACPPGFVGDTPLTCKPEEKGCKEDYDCPSQTACIKGECVNPCNATTPCGINANCKVLDTVPVRTMICECLPGYQGNAAVQCEPIPTCRIDKGFIRNENGECVCPPGTGLNENDDCIRCPEQNGLKVDERGRCVCALERGMIIDERGNCICPIGLGYKLNVSGYCIKRDEHPECEIDEQCPDNRYCNPATKTCDDPCLVKECGENAFCNAANHKALCQCIAGYSGDANTKCSGPPNFRTDFPQPNMSVSCLSDGVQVQITFEEPQGFSGVLYVKGHSKDEQCRRVVTLTKESPLYTEVFKVHFGKCGLIHVNGQASFVLVIQKHPKLVTYKAQAYHIKCVYQTGEQNVTLGFNVSMLTTAGTIANTGPPPTCTMRIVTQTGQEINQAEIGDNLQLQVEVQPASIYGGFARSCIAKTMEDSIENEYIVTDENGCATDPTIFGEWDYNPDTQSLLASFNAFKFPSSDNIRFQCNIRVCFGKCQPVNCRGYNAFGRRRREIAEPRNNTEVAIAESVYEGQLREEITIQSNAILTFERREERFVDPTEAPDVQRMEDICVSMIGFIIALVITALLALVAVAVAVSCWLMAYRRKPKTTGPLPHPPEFPNPLFTTPEPVAEPSPDYLS